MSDQEQDRVEPFALDCTGALSTPMPIDKITPAPCFKCAKKLEPVFEWENGSRQPQGATTFEAIGQYGSTVFDPPQPRRIRRSLQINICDVCLRTVAELRPGTILHLEHLPPQTPPPIVTAWQPDEDDD